MILDVLASRYGLLPSEVLARGDTLDYLVFDVAESYRQYQRELADAKSKGLPPPAPKDLTVNKLQDMIEKVRR